MVFQRASSYCGARTEQITNKSWPHDSDDGYNPVILLENGIRHAE